MTIASKILGRIQEEKLTTAARDAISSRDFALPGRNTDRHKSGRQFVKKLRQDILR